MNSIRNVRRLKRTGLLFRAAGSILPRWTFVIVIMALFVEAMPGLVGSVSAHAEGDTFEIFRGREGSYQVIVGVQPEKPVEGVVHISVTALEAETLLPVDDAIITVVALNDKGEPTFQAPALPGPDSALYYDANITFDAPGAWSLLVKLESKRLGKATFPIPLEIGAQPLESGVEGTIVFLVIIAILVGGTAYVWYSARYGRKFVRA